MSTNYKRYLAKFDSDRKVKFLNNSIIFKDIELKFGIQTNFGPLNSKCNIKVQFDVIMTS